MCVARSCVCRLPQFGAVSVCSYVDIIWGGWVGIEEKLPPGLKRNAWNETVGDGEELK